MTNIETQISQIGTMQENLTSNEAKMHDKIEDYDRSIHYYSQVCDDVIRSNTNLKENVNDVKSKVDYLLKQQAEINI